MRIAIITWCSYPNFGTYLQAYAMQWQLHKMGHEAKLLDDSIYTTKVSQPKFLRLKTFCIVSAKKAMSLSYRKTLRKDQESLILYDSFRKKHLDIDKCINPLYCIDKRYDCYICGSDQIWSPISLKSNGKEFFFANFTRKPRIAYAPSGLVNYPLYARAELTRLIEGFNSLSVREPDAAIMLKKIINKDVEVVVDPTLLVPKDAWNVLIPAKTPPSSPYILLYLLKKNKLYLHAAKQYANKNGYTLKIIHSMHVDHKEDTISAGPSEFLYLIKNAQIVMTDSFHGMIFSIIFQRPFVAFQRFNVNEENSQNSRVVNLLSMVELSDRLIDEHNIEIIDNLDEIDYEEVCKKLNTYTENSKKYLDNAIKSICNG